MDVRMKEIGGETYLSTLSIYKYIGLSAHQKLKEKVKRMNLELHDTQGLGTSITLPTGVRILESYRLTLTDSRLTQVNQLLTELNQRLNSVNPKSSMVKPRLSSIKPTVDTVNPIKPKVNQSKPDLTKLNQEVKPSKPESKPKQVKLNQTKPKLTENSSKKNTIKSPPKIRSQPKRNALVEVLLGLPDYIRTEYFIFMVLIFAIGIQVHHTAELYLRVSEDGNYWIGVITAYIFGAVSELTALLLTVHQGNRKMLKVFAIFSCWMNLLYYKVWEGFAWTPEYVTHLISEVTLSGFIAFVIFIYAHLFTLDIFEKEKAEK